MEAFHFAAKHCLQKHEPQGCSKADGGVLERMLDGLHRRNQLRTFQPFQPLLDIACMHFSKFRKAKNSGICRQIKTFLAL
jgi:hypothetical protein